MAGKRNAPKEDTLRQGFGKTFDEAVQKALSPAFRRGEVGNGRAEVIFSEIIRTNPDLQYHVVVRFPSN